MTSSNIPHPLVVTREQWLVERKKLLTHEKELTKHSDHVNAERRQLPMVKIDKDYVFDGPNGKQNLGSLFEGRRQLIVDVLPFLSSFIRRVCFGYAPDRGVLRTQLV